MEIFTDTPWWVYIFFVFLILVGLQSTKPRTIPIKRIVILPAIFMVWNILWLAERTEGQLSLAAFLILGFIVGSFIGWQTAQAWHIYADHKRKLISVPGTWTTLIFILLVFSVRYYFVYNYINHPQSAPHLFTPDALISGLFTGIFIGRAFELYRKYKNH
jgi:hypothetical protein